MKIRLWYRWDQIITNYKKKWAREAIIYGTKVSCGSKSSPKASNGQQFLCPALLFLVFMGGSRATARIGDEVLQNGDIFCPSVCFFVRSSVHPSSHLAGPRPSQPGLRTSQPGFRPIRSSQSGLSPIPLTIWCLWAIGSSSNNGQFSFDPDVRNELVHSRLPLKSFFPKAF